MNYDPLLLPSEIGSMRSDPFFTSKEANDWISPIQTATLLPRYYPVWLLFVLAYTAEISIGALDARGIGEE